MFFIFEGEKEQEEKKEAGAPLREEVADPRQSARDLNARGLEGGSVLNGDFRRETALAR